MSTRMICPECGCTGRVPERAIGKTIQCPGCGANFGSRFRGGSDVEVMQVISDGSGSSQGVNGLLIVSVIVAFLTSFGLFLFFMVSKGIFAGLIAFGIVAVFWFAVIVSIKAIMSLGVNNRSRKI